MTHAEAPVLALDVDGVILDYLAGLAGHVRDSGLEIACEGHEMADWMMSDMLPHSTPEERYAFVVSFAVSKRFGELGPVVGAHEGIEELRRRRPDLRIVAITSAGSEAVTDTMRRASLAAFGIDEVTVLPLGASKLEHLKALPQGSVLVDDLIKNVRVAEQAGQRGILFRAPYNEADAAETAVRGWGELVETLDTHFGMEAIRAGVTAHAGAASEQEQAPAPAPGR